MGRRKNGGERVYLLFTEQPDEVINVLKVNFDSPLDGSLFLAGVWSVTYPFFMPVIAV